MKCFYNPQENPLGKKGGETEISFFPTIILYSSICICNLRSLNLLPDNKF